MLQSNTETLCSLFVTLNFTHFTITSERKHWTIYIIHRSVWMRRHLYMTLVILFYVRCKKMHPTLNKK